jgi:hypothetical protein
MLRHYGESDIAHGASASFDYLLHITRLGIPESECPGESAGLSVNTPTSDSVIVAIRGNHRNYMFLVAVDRRNVRLLRTNLRSDDATGKLRRDGVLPVIWSGSGRSRRHLRLLN